MTIKELRSNYAEELALFPGEGKLRYELLSPVLRNLHESKVVYYEKFIGIVRLEDIKITSEEFLAIANSYLLIERHSRFDPYFFKIKKWKFGAKWKYMRLLGSSINVPYANWTIWCDPDTVKAVEELTLKKMYPEALNLTLNEGKI